MASSDALKHFARMRDDEVNLTGIVEHILLNLRIESGMALPDNLEERLLDLRFSTAQLNRLAAQYFDTYSRERKSEKENFSTNQSKNVIRLTILAAIFLPLSLSTSILTMNTRFADFHLLLYDFIGVFVLLGSITIFIYFTIFIVMKLSLLLNDIPEEFTSSKPKRIVFPFLIALWALITTSFIIGIVKDVILGLKILGCGLGGIFSIFYLGIPLVRYILVV
jgi:hypothetical protein